jgi:crotonobetainyl-CoA:carnitine CoA-transferase CaiB-like acyl-CoA transferase
MIPGVLNGVKVIEFGQNLAGPYCGQILAFMGAEVIKVEKPEGDDARKWGPPFIAGEGVNFVGLNRGKKSISIDLNDAAQKQRLIDLIGTADAFVHNLRAGVTEKFGIDGKTMTAKFPGLVYADLSAFGHTGPWKMRPGYEPLIQAEAGLVSVNGDPSGPASRIGVSIIDLSTGMWTAIGILGALLQKARTGKGCVVSTSLFESGLMWVSTHVASFSTTGNVPPRQSTGHITLTPYQAFETSNGLLMVTPGNDRLWAKFAETLGKAEWVTDPRFLTNKERSAHRPMLLDMITEIMKRDTKESWAAKLQAMGVPCGPINAIPEVVALEHTKALGMYLQPYSELPSLLHALPVSFDGQRAGFPAQVPKIGEHDGEV